MFTDDFLPVLWLASIFLPLLCAACSLFSKRWLIARRLAGGSLLLSLLAWLASLVTPPHDAGLALFHITPFNGILLVLIAFIAFVVLCYAQSNFSGDPDNVRFLRWFTLTVFAVMLTVASNHLLLFWFSWV